MIISRLVTVLIADVAALPALAGGELFQHLAHACIAAHPSVLPNARRFGLLLGLFLASDANFVLQPMLNEMAKFEWAINHPYDSADDTVVNIASWLICQAILTHTQLSNTPFPASHRTRVERSGVLARSAPGQDAADIANDTGSVFMDRLASRAKHLFSLAGAG